MSERATQNRVIKLFCDELGYAYQGDWTERARNSNIEESLLTAYLTRAGYVPAQISAALHQLHLEADNHQRSPSQCAPNRPGGSRATRLDGIGGTGTTRLCKREPIDRSG